VNTPVLALLLGADAVVGGGAGRGALLAAPAFGWMNCLALET